ncbi:MAG: hypothetical protein AB7L66_13620 [Gemmatimonadales bacterium]
MRVLGFVSVVAVAALGAACDDPFAILPAAISNTVDTVEMYAVNGTALDKPSGYLMVSRLPIRLGIDQTAYNFDFLYRIDSTGTPQFVPYAAIAPSSTASSSTQGRPGFLETQTAFDAIDEGEQTGYITDQPANLAVGKRFYVRSGLPNGCYLGIPYYGKIEIISFDEAARSVKMQILVDVNCGYRGLLPGLPEK